jgi:hypothetical protein
MDRRAAAEIIPMLVRAAQEVADTVAVYQRFGSPVDVKPYSDAVGVIVGAHYEVLRRIVDEHPDLDPGGFRLDPES